MTLDKRNALSPDTSGSRHTTAIRKQATALAKAVMEWGAHRLTRSGLTARFLSPAKGHVDFGGLRRLSPISRRYGYDRGEPVDRYYIDQFLDTHRERIFGTVLEISENTYTRRFGGERVARSEVLHYDDPSPPATVVGDLTDAPHLPSDHYDCIIITQTLMFIYDVRAAVETLHRILKPGGTVLATQAGLSQIADGPWNHTWHWGFTQVSTRRLFEDAFAGGDVEVRTHGNVLSAIALLHGLSHDELAKDELDRTDPEYQVLISVAARKAPAREA